MIEKIKDALKVFVMTSLYGIFMLTATRKERKFIWHLTKKFIGMCEKTDEDVNFVDNLKQMDEMEFVEKVYTTAYQFDMYDEEVVWCFQKWLFLFGWL